MVYGFSPYGSRGYLVRVEVDVRRGLPGTDIVGLASSEVRECRERVRVAIRNSGFEYPADRILVSLSPAEIPKVGAGFDLPVALAILQKTAQIKLPDILLATGEISIHGEVLPVRGILSAVIAASEQGISTVLVPAQTAADVVGAGDLVSTILVLRTLNDLASGDVPALGHTGSSPRKIKTSALSMDDIQGQSEAKRAAMVSAAGYHNLLLMGPPGSGKTMTARRLASLMPPLTRSESLEVARVHSIRGLDVRENVARPPVRMPHHSVSQEGMLGGGRHLLPGEASLAHRGVLILDEVPEFRPQVLQALREPVEERFASISRAGQAEQFSTSFVLVMTSNLCPCGNLGRRGSLCLCSMQEIARYWRRVGAALLDRVDLRVMTDYRLVEQPPGADHSAHEMKERIAAAVARQEKRSAGASWKRNGTVPAGAVETMLPLSDQMKTLIQEMMRRHALSDRAAQSVRAVARTLADLGDRENVTEEDVQAAVSWRARGVDSLLGREDR